MVVRDTSSGYMWTFHLFLLLHRCAVRRTVHRPPHHIRCRPKYWATSSSSDMS